MIDYGKIIAPHNTGADLDTEFTFRYEDVLAACKEAVKQSIPLVLDRGKDVRDSGETIYFKGEFGENRSEWRVTKSRHVKLDELRVQLEKEFCE